jgi:hypothetical protein
MIKIYGPTTVAMVPTPGDTPEVIAKAEAQFSTPAGIEAQFVRDVTLRRVENRSALAADQSVLEDKLLKRGTNMPTPDKNAVAGMLDDYAKAQRQPGETVAKAYLRLVKSDRFAKSLFDTHQTMQRSALSDRVVAKRAAPVDGSAYDAISALGETIRKREPTLTKAQAFSRAYTDPANRSLVEIFKREQRGLPPDAA